MTREPLTNKAKSLRCTVTDKWCHTLRGRLSPEVVTSISPFWEDDLYKKVTVVSLASTANIRSVSLALETRVLCTGGQRPELENEIKYL